MKSFDPVEISFNSSKSLLYPFFIRLPSCRVNGASSFIDLSNNSYNSSYVFIVLSYSNSFNILFISGNTPNDFFNCIKSMIF